MFFFFSWRLFNCVLYLVLGLVLVQDLITFPLKLVQKYKNL